MCVIACPRMSNSSGCNPQQCICIKCYSRSVRETLKFFLVCSETMCQCVIACLTPQCATLSLNKHFICTCLTSDKCELSSSDKCEFSSSFKCFSRSVRNASHAVSETLKFFLVWSETMFTPSCGSTAVLCYLQQSNIQNFLVQSLRNLEAC